jgi:hypothetical protein
MSLLNSRTMTVGQLKMALEQFDDDMHVVFQGDYGDRVNTPEVHWIRSPEEAFITKTSYSKTGWKVCFERSDRDEDDPEVVVLSFEENY